VKTLIAGTMRMWEQTDLTAAGLSRVHKESEFGVLHTGTQESHNHVFTCRARDIRTVRNYRFSFHIYIIKWFSNCVCPLGVLVFPLGARLVCLRDIFILNKICKKNVYFGGHFACLK
jgi:hypothetical protein